MATDTESFNRDLYDLLKVRGYDPTPLDSKNQRVSASQDADVIEFTFRKDGDDYGSVWVTVDDAQNVIIYYDNEQQESPSTKTPGVDYDDSWTGLLKFLKNWAQRRQMSFELQNKDRLGDDMRQREYYKMKEKLGESKKVNEVSTDTEDSYYMKAVPQKGALARTRQSRDFENLPKDVKDRINQTFDKRRRGTERFVNKHWDELVKPMDQQRPSLQVKESYHPMGKKASYNDAVPSVKIILQHNRALEEGEQRYRNVARIFLENTDGERFLAPTNKPGLARVYARHIAEGGVPNDDRWNHIKTVCEDYSKMAGFVRATRNGQFNESAQELVNEGVNHYNNLRETLHKLAGHRGYQAYFESWTPTLMEGEGEDLSEMFMSQSLDPRIESAIPILSRLKKPVTEMDEVSSLAEWADDIISEKLEMDSTTKSMAVPADKMLEAPGAETLSHNQKTAKSNLKAFGLAEDTAEYVVSAMPKFQPKKLQAKSRDDAVDQAARMWGIPANKITLHGSEDGGDQPASNRDAGAPEGGTAIDRATHRAKNPKDPWYKPIANPDDLWNIAKLAIGVAEGDVVPFKKKHDDDDDEDWDDDSWIPSIEDFEQEEEIRNRKRHHDNDLEETSAEKNAKDTKKTFPNVKHLTKGGHPDWKKHGIDAPTKDEVDEDLDANQKRVGQLGPTEKVKNNNIGKLVGASESKEMDPELARIIEMAKFKR